MRTKQHPLDTRIQVRKTTSRIVRAVCLLPIFILVGCASSYDCYTCGPISCNYCPPRALPYSTFESCVCNDSIGRAYLATLAPLGSVTVTQDEIASEGLPDPDSDYYDSDSGNDSGDNNDNDNDNDSGDNNDADSGSDSR